MADDVATYLNNKKRRELAKIEDDADISVQIYGREGVPPEHLAVECFDGSGRDLKFPIR